MIDFLWECGEVALRNDLSFEETIALGLHCSCFDRKEIDEGKWEICTIDEDYVTLIPKHTRKISIKKKYLR